MRFYSSSFQFSLWDSGEPSGEGLRGAWWTFNSLYEILCPARSCRFQRGRPFNSLYEIQTCGVCGGGVSGRSFQFSLWDSLVEFFDDTAIEPVAFNSLYEIPGLFSGGNVLGTFRSFNSLYEILNLLNHFQHALSTHFQFSLWDSNEDRERSQSKSEGAFNSLYEIPDVHDEEGNVTFIVYTFNSLYEIPRSITKILCLQSMHDFQFSLWDSC